MGKKVIVLGRPGSGKTTAAHAIRYAAEVIGVPLSANG